ncbi:MAG: chemotaxis protein CheW [Anaerolineae bacterium]|nr:chemotaxis protein CheW [Anaerolineae bacterium]
MAQLDRSDSVQWLTFRLDAGEYALDIRDVIEVLGMVALKPMPQTQPWLAGLLNLRGRVVPVIDLRRRLGLAPRSYGLDTPIIVARQADRPVGLIVDEATEVLTLPGHALTLPDALTGAEHAVSTVARLNDRLILQLDLDRVCASVPGMPTGVVMQAGVEG